jgi:hypothetical protein
MPVSHESHAAQVAAKPQILLFIKCAACCLPIILKTTLCETDMIDCKVKMPPEGKEVLVRLGYRFAVAYWLKVNGKPVWLPGSALNCDFDKGNALLGEPVAWSYLPTLTSAEATDSYAS